jgi:hypothetical protein
MFKKNLGRKWIQTPFVLENNITMSTAFFYSGKQKRINTSSEKKKGGQRISFIEANEIQPIRHTQITNWWKFFTISKVVP